jgi:hypothetical protein
MKIQTSTKYNKYEISENIRAFVEEEAKNYSFECKKIGHVTFNPTYNRIRAWHKKV